MNDGVPLIPYRTDGYQMLQKDKPPSRRASVEIQWDKVGTEYSVHAQLIILPYLPEQKPFRHNVPCLIATKIHTFWFES